MRIKSLINSNKFRGPWRITFDTNPDQCNANCIMCEEHSNYNKNIKHQNRQMDFYIIEKVVNEAIKYGLREIIPSTMGEPLLYSKFEELLNLTKKFNLKINITTNGTFPKLGVERWGQLILPFSSDVKISINGATNKTAEHIMSGIDFEKQLENISKFLEVRDLIRKNKINDPTITFQITFMESNLEELPELLKLAIEMNIDRFKGHHLWITHPELNYESLRRNDDSIHRWNEIVKKLNRLAETHRLKEGKKIVLDNVYPLTYLKDNNKIPNNWICPFLGREAWVAWDGIFNVCCSPDNLRKSFGYFGNVMESNFIELWNSNKYDNLIKNWRNYEVCKICNMRKPRNERWRH